MSNPIRQYYDNGKLWRETYRVNDELHREDGPAYIECYEDGQKLLEMYYLHGEIHRTDGPAIIEWDEDGNITDQFFALSGNRASVYDVLDDKEAFEWAMIYGDNCKNKP